MAKRKHNTGGNATPPANAAPVDAAASVATPPAKPVKPAGMGEQEWLWRSRSVRGAETILNTKASLAQLKGDTVINLLIEGNPKIGKVSRQAFACYSNGMTVDQFAKAVGKGALGHVAWDFNNGFIGLTPAAVAAPAETPVDAQNEEAAAEVETPAEEEHSEAA